MKVAQSCPTLCDPVNCSLDPLSMGFSKQEYWSGLPFSSPGDLPYSGIIPASPALQADSLPPEPPGKLQITYLTKDFYLKYIKNFLKSKPQ